ncbi:MAG: DoxX family protein [Anaerolineae bacterium]|nr:DoxX family protein [Anaerolineae bacterium]
MSASDFKRTLPGWLAVGFVIFVTSGWTFWGIAELYYEGWGLPFPEPLAYLIPAAVCFLFTILALRWPRLGGWILILCGGLFTAWWWNLSARRAGGLTWQIALSLFPVSGLLIISGGLFLIEGRRRRQLHADGETPHTSWIRRNLSYLIALGIPLLIVIGVSAFQLPVVLGRYDDGDYEARLIEGNDVALIWAPAGPGWNWRQEWGGFPSWASLARYGKPPIGLDGKRDIPALANDMDKTSLCTYLTADGLSLAETPQNLWRMPTVDELARSLGRDGQNAGCIWDGEEEQLSCAVTPDKDMPLWNPSSPPIYYWAADELNAKDAYYVSYNGWVNTQPKTFGNPRHGYRCVREP